MQHRETAGLALQKKTPQSLATCLTLSDPAQRDAWLANKIATLQSLFPNSPLTAAANEIYLDELDSLLCDIGADAFNAVLRSCIRECKFMPTIAEIRSKAGLDPAKLLAAAQYRAWHVAVRWMGKWRYSTEAGYLADCRNERKAKCFRRGKQLPARIRYAAAACGGGDAMSATDAKDLSFVRQRFDSSYEQFPASEKAAPDNLDPFSGVVSDDELLASEIVDGDGNIVPGDVKLVSFSEWRKLEYERVRLDDEEYRRNRTPEQKAEDEEQRKTFNRLFSVLQSKAVLDGKGERVDGASEGVLTQ